MTRAPRWSGSDIKPATPAKPAGDDRRHLSLHIDARTYAWLQAVAREQGGPLKAVAESVLREVALDDVAAHGGSA